MSDHQGRVAGKVALITGAAQGMGAAHARVLAREGATVAVADIADRCRRAARRRVARRRRQKLLPRSRRHRSRRVARPRRRRGTGPRPDRHPRQQRRHPVSLGRHRSGRRGVGQGDGRQPARRFPRHARRHPGHDQKRRGLDRQHRVGRRARRPVRIDPVPGEQSGRSRFDARGRGLVRAGQHPRERDLPRPGRDRA